MSPNQCWIILHVSILAGLLFTLNADSEDLKQCETEIKVRRNTVYKAFVGQELRINCTVVFCNNSQTVSWYKVEKTSVPVNMSNDSHIKTDWITLKHLEGISLLIFKNILSSDSGLYGCQSGGSVSHTINVSVYDKAETTTHPWIKTTAQTTNGNSEDDKDDLWMYIYCAAGIVGFVVLVIIISVISMQGCKGKSKKKTQTDNQYMEIPMVEQPSSQRPPRGSPSTPSSQRSIRRTQQLPEPSDLPVPRDNEHVYGKIREDRKRKRNVVEEEGSSVVYAALNHQLPPRAAARPLRPQEEFSEYAAIRVF